MEIEDNIWTHVDVEYLFECSTRFLMSEHNFVSYIDILIITFLTIFRSFPTLFEDSRRFPEICPKATQTFWNISRKFPKITKDNQRFPKTFKEDLKMFQSYTNKI